MSDRWLSPVWRDLAVQGRLALAHPRRVDATLARHSAPRVAEPALDAAPEPPPVAIGPSEEDRREGYDAGLAQGLAEGLARSSEEARRLAELASEEAGRERARQTERLTRELTQQIDARYTARIEQLDTLIAALPPEIDARLAASEDDLVALCFETVCRVLGDQAARPEAVRAQFGAALKGLRGRRLVAVHLHPDDLAVLRVDGEPGPIGVGGPGIEWIGSAEVKLGGCILQSPEGGLDARLETQLDTLRKALLQARSGGLR